MTPEIIQQQQKKSTGKQDVFCTKKQLTKNIKLSVYSLIL